MNKISKRKIPTTSSEKKNFQKIPKYFRSF